MSGWGSCLKFCSRVGAYSRRGLFEIGNSRINVYEMPMHFITGAVIPRMLGQRITQSDKSHHNSMTASSFFKMYPKLSDFFIKILQHGGVCERNLTRLPGLIPVLTILSKLRPSKETE